jgi:branched-chain amino acid transport system permease protein
MAVSDVRMQDLRIAIERPGTVLVALIVAVLVLDLILKLLGASLSVFGVKVLGGFLSVNSLIGYVIDGLVVGMAIGLAGIGLSMTYSILNFANFAHGDTVTAGSFFGWTVTYLIAGTGATSFESQFLLSSNLGITILRDPITIIVGLIVAAVGTILLSLVIDRLVYRSMRDADGISLLIASVGVALALRYLIAFIWQTGNKGVTQIPAKLTVLETITLTTHEWALLVIAGVLMLGVHVLLQWTKLGKAMRAMADNKSLARVTGIPTERVIRMTWIIGGGLTGVAGYLLTLESGTIAFDFGWVLLLLIFSAVILGGIGSIYGAMAGGVLIGIVDKIALIWLPPGLTRAAAFFVLIVVLLIRPEGLFGGVKTA